MRLPTADMYPMDPVRGCCRKTADRCLTRLVTCRRSIDSTFARCSLDSRGFMVRESLARIAKARKPKAAVLRDKAEELGDDVRALG